MSVPNKKQLDKMETVKIHEKALKKAEKLCPAAVPTHRNIINCLIKSINK